MNNVRVGSFDILDSQAAEGMPTEILDSIEAELISCVTVDRRIHSEEVYRQRVDSLQERIRGLSPVLRELLQARFDMEVRA